MSDNSLESINRQNYIKVVLDRFEGKFAVLKTSDGQELLWPIKNLPEEAKEGSGMRLILATAKTDQEEREKLAKTILNEILSGQ